MTTDSVLLHDDGMTWKRFPHYWPFVRGINRSLAGFPITQAVMRSFSVFFGMNKLLNKEPSCHGLLMGRTVMAHFSERQTFLWWVNYHISDPVIFDRKTLRVYSNLTKLCVICYRCRCDVYWTLRKIIPITLFNCSIGHGIKYINKLNYTSKYWQEIFEARTCAWSRSYRADYLYKWNDFNSILFKLPFVWP